MKKALKKAQKSKVKISTSSLTNLMAMSALHSRIMAAGFSLQNAASWAPPFNMESLDVFKIQTRGCLSDVLPPIDLHLAAALKECGFDLPCTCAMDCQCGVIKGLTPEQYLTVLSLLVQHLTAELRSHLNKVAADMVTK